MAQGLAFDLKDLMVSNSSFGPREIERISQVIAEDYTQFKVLRDAVMELESHEGRTPAAQVRLGVGLFLLGRFEPAAQILKNADSGALAYYYMARAQFELGKYDEAIASYGSAQTAGYNKDVCALGVSEAYRRQGALEKSLQTLDNLSGAVEQTAEYLYQRSATVSALGGGRKEVVALLERAVEADDNHAGALFGLALQNDRHGNDTQAVELYQRAAKQFPTHVGTLLNLGVLYEDMQHFERAKQCYSRILESYPSHKRARLFFKDADASRDMFYDEEARRRQDRLAQILSVPVTDFELSVRSRNCLKKMNINTLGDLLRTTEPELLAYKNFGETSLKEIKAMLAHKGLILGQLAHEKRGGGGGSASVVKAPSIMPAPGVSADIYNRSVATLELSVRSRKCLQVQGINTVGELTQRTEAELMASRNFGQTSLNEIKGCLSELGVSLRSSDV
ncbi:MAG: tetratricopeptide repeat protein [Phycisphaerales bacterium]|nr:tetratricopeptide repeat protein [Phycisphaerales bacterium]